MTNFIELTTDDDTKILVNSDFIICVTDCGENGCEVQVVDDEETTYSVKETFETIRQQLIY